MSTRLTPRRALLAVTAAAAAAVVLPAGPSAAQEHEDGTSAETAAMMEAYRKAATPGEAHEALARTAGTWTATVRYWMEPGGEPSEMEGSVEIEPVMDGRFIREKVTSEWMGAPFHGVSIVGYNNTTGEVEGVWYDNHSTMLYTSRGTLSDAGDEITLRSKYRDPVSGTWIEGRSVRRITGDRMTETAWETRDGAEHKTMEIVYVRDGS